MCIVYYVTNHIWPIDCLLIGNIPDLSPVMGQGMPMAWAKIWVLLKAADAESAAFSKAHLLACVMGMPWLTSRARAINRQSRSNS